MNKKILDWLIAFDAWVMFTFFGGLPNETISAAAHNALITGRIGGIIFVPIIDAIFYLFQRDHCHQAWLWQNSIYKAGKR